MRLEWSLYLFFSDSVEISYQSSLDCPADSEVIGMPGDEEDMIVD